MPSTVEINDEEDEAFPRAEPAAHLEEIVLYGENPIPFEKLDAWVKTSLFNLEIKIKYPWDFIIPFSLSTLIYFHFYLTVLKCVFHISLAIVIKYLLIFLTF